MQAEIVRTGWFLTAIALTGVTAAAVIAREGATAALPPVADPQEQSSDEIAPTAVTVRDTARYVLHDLDGDGVAEMIVEADGPNGPEMVVMEAVDHTPLARIPLASPGNPCARNFGIDEDGLRVDEYAPPSRDSDECQWVGEHHVRIHGGVLIDF
jgi:hypothetical protein